MSIEKPSKAPESENEQMNIQAMEQELRDKGIAFPARWEEFNDEQKLRAMNLFKTGGLTALGFQTNDSILDTNDEIVRNEQEEPELEEEDEQFESE